MNFVNEESKRMIENGKFNGVLDAVHAVIQRKALLKQENN